MCVTPACLSPMWTALALSTFVVSIVLFKIVSIPHSKSGAQIPVGIAPTVRFSVQSLCSHKLADGPGKPGPTTKGIFEARASTFAKSLDISCFDLDVSEVHWKATAGTAAKRVIGHPADVAADLAAGILTASTAIDALEGIKLLRHLSIEVDRRLCVTVELKGSLGSDVAFMHQLLEAAGTTTGTSETSSAEGTGGSLDFAVLGVHTGVEPPPGLQLAFAMRDQTGSQPQQQQQAHSCGVDPHDSDGVEFAASSRRYSVLMPSAACLELPHVRNAIKKWRARFSQASAPANATGVPGNWVGGGDEERQRHSEFRAVRSFNSCGPGDVRVWTIDDQHTAKRVIAKGATHVISNAASDFAKSFSLR